MSRKSRAVAKKASSGEVRLPKLSSGSYPTARIELNHVFACFKKGAKDEKGEKIFAETSAIIYDKASKGVLIASDKEFPGHSAFVEWPYPFTATSDSEHLATAKYFDWPAFVATKKVEELAATLDGKWMFATSAFDRYAGLKTPSRDPKAPIDWAADNYCNLLAWPATDPSKVQIVEASKNKGGVVSSARLVKRFESVLDNQKYHKFEGLVVMPDNWLVWGLREVGKDFKNFQYVVTLVGTRFRLPRSGSRGGAVKLDPEMEITYEFEPKEVIKGLPDLAVSSLDYNPKTEVLSIVTTYEKDGMFGAYFWLLTLDGYLNGDNPTIVVDATNTSIPFRVANKAEGATWYGNKQMLLICDDDREAETSKAPGFIHHAPNTSLLIQIAINYDDLPGGDYSGGESGSGYGSEDEYSDEGTMSTASSTSG